MAACQSSAQSAGAVRTLLQRVRPIPGLTSRQFQERQAAQRKVVNSIIQVRQDASHRMACCYVMRDLGACARALHCGAG
jgi:DNA polymerase I-like protein with 3'-5' exonuclease and polymerase domains